MIPSVRPFDFQFFSEKLARLFDLTYQREGEKRKGSHIHRGKRVSASSTFKVLGCAQSKNAILTAILTKLSISRRPPRQLAPYSTRTTSTECGTIDAISSHHHSLKVSIMKFEPSKVSRLITGGVFALAFASAASSAFAQGATSSGAGAGNSGTTTGTSGTASSVTHPEAGANNDPALAEPKPGPTGAPGLGTESGSPDANGLHSNVAMPLPSPAK